jgi:pimeloyl-ACP methyl ester carboxylesterase
LLVSQVSARGPAKDLLSIKANGVEFHFVSEGNGAPLVFVHGGLDDYRMWKEEMAPFSRDYRVVAYSRRHNFPNHNLPFVRNYSAAVDAEDLAALIEKLNLGRVHLIAHSYGGYAALFLATRHPELVRSLVLAEPAVLCWGADRPSDRPLFEEFMRQMWQPVGEALRRSRDTRALRLALEYLDGAGAFEHLPREARAGLRENLPEWRALTSSQDAFPPLSREKVKQVRAPALLLTSEHTLPIFQAVDAQLGTFLPHVSVVKIPKAGHEMWAENGAACRDATLRFLRKEDPESLTLLPWCAQWVTRAA